LHNRFPGTELPKRHEFGGIPLSFVREKSLALNTNERVAKDGEKKRIAPIASNYRSEREKNNII